MATEEELRAYLKRAAIDLHRTRQRLQEVENRSSEPIAVIGMGCRYPGGVKSAEDLWQMVADGRDVISEFPTDRGWDVDGLYHPDPDHEGTSYSSHGGFLDSAADFDAAFFGISPREALAMEPQQRHMLEVAWEALERAGIDPNTLRGTDTGVFAGIIEVEYGPTIMEDRSGLAGWLLIGRTSSVASGRVAYSLGLEGPAVSLDTACSSSLVAIHQAANSLRSGECSLALAGGATIMPTPEAFIAFSRQRVISADGRAKAFAAAADGTTWSEGVGLLVLERLSDAQKNGHPILAVLRGSAVNQDGASNGLTAPNGPSQRRVIEAALRNAKIPASGVDVVEAHGTGTPLGDPIEANALLATYGQDRTTPLLLGSIKSNIGHSSAAAGVAGAIKMIMAMRHGTVPPTLHVDEPSHQVDWDAGAVELVTEATQWPEVDRPRRAAVSAFGISGTNSHVIFEQAPAPTTEASGPEETGVQVEPAATAWVVSAATAPALSDQIARLSTFLDDHPEHSPVDIGYSLATQRARFAHRAVVLGSTREELIAALKTAGAIVEDAATADSGANVAVGVAGSSAKTAVMFPGQGAQRVGMGRALYERYPVYADAFDEVCARLDPALGRSLREVVFAEPDTDEAALLDHTAFTQAALFAVEVALFRLAESFGVRPDLVLGHSIGEISAAHVAGVLSLDDAATLVAARGRLMQALPEGGAMLSVRADEQTVLPLLSGRESDVAVAAINSPSALTISGAAEVVDDIAAELRSLGHTVKPLRVSHAFHSPLMEPMLAEFAAVAASLTYQRPAIPIISNVTGAVAEPEQLCTPEYWVRHVREAVRFADGVRAAHDFGATVFLEVGPGASSTTLVDEVLNDGVDEAVAVATSLLRPKHDEPIAFYAGLAAAHAAGTAVDWTQGIDVRAVAQVDLPTYAFQHRRYWLDKPTGTGDVAGVGLGVVDHPLLGAKITQASGGDDVLVTGLLSTRAQPWLADHVVGGSILVPGTAFVEIALLAGGQVGVPRIGELVLQAPLVLPERGGVEVQAVVGGSGDDRPITIYSRPQQLDDEGEQAEWTVHATGSLVVDDVPAVVTAELATWPVSGATAVEIGDPYAELADAGYGYGPVFQGLRAVWRRGEELFAEVELPEQARGAAGAFGIHPALLDAALHAMAVAGGDTDGDQIRLPFAWEGVTLHAVGATAVRVRLAATGTDRMSITAVDAAGAPVVTVDGLSLRAMSRDALGGSTKTAAAEGLYALTWVPQPVIEAAQGNWEPYADVENEYEEVVTTGSDKAVVLRFGSDTAEVPGPDAVRTTVTTVLRRVQDVLADERNADATLVVVTSHAVSIEGAEPIGDLAVAPVWGLLRSAQAEQPDRIQLVDVDDADDYRAAVAATLGGSEGQVAFRRGVPHVPRLARPGADSAAGSAMVGTQPWLLTSLGKGTLHGDNIVLVESSDSEPLQPGEVRVQLRASGMNFRDVLIVLGMYPDPDAPIGGEGAGIIVDVAADVTEFAIGDKVMGLFSGLGSTVVSDQRMVAAMPEGWTYAQAAAVPAVFGTAYYSLVDLAGVQAGESLLIHAATGGVGMAATQLARHLGLEVYATASEPKWKTLREIGYDDAHIGNSRTLDFEQKFLAATDGRGVDVVLDSLAGDFVDASLRLLPRGGRFIEMGQTDVRDPEKIAQEYPGVAYRGFVLMEAGPDRLHEILTELVALFASGALQPLPVTTWDVRRAPEAFRFLSQARHVGKNVLTIPALLDPEGTVLVTGGTGVLGGEIARHLVQARGMRHLVLTSRSGSAAAGASELREELIALGAEVEIAACDVADRDALAALLADIPQAHPLTAVVHTAGVTDDAVFGAQTPKSLETALRPKVDAAWNLHEATQDLALAEFVLYSSVAGVLGGPGQANYAAANVYLDALAQHRQRLGLPATSIAWGLWAQASGITAELSDIDRARMRRDGMIGIDTTDGVVMFDNALSMGAALTVAARLDLAAIRAAGADDPTLLPPPLRGLLRAAPRRAGGGAGEAGESSSLAKSLLAMSPVDQERTMLNLIRLHAAAVLGHDSPDEIGPGQAFTDLGFDSLGAVEFRNRLKSATGLKLTTTVVFDYPTPAILAQYMCEEIVPADAAAARILAEIDTVASGFAAAALSSAERVDIADRLDELLRAVRGEEDDAVISELGSAADDELFEFFDNDPASLG
ncbi:type I polyketide synthase [Nocardia salmonicida]|uniref:type I polyketide synthase n=1 Tax=Nocardia salmonicida TaxID=53431 RepID=UPI0007A52AA8|nr:type I polyketide synthase [Nocardia salmonicida]